VNSTIDAFPIVASVQPGSSAERAGVRVGDAVARVNGVTPRDILEWQRLVESDVVELEVLRGRDTIEVEVERSAGEAFGVSIDSAVFDRIHTCDNHCEFCFIYQLPKGMRKSLYLKDDDYRLSFLFGNFTTLTRFTEADLERVIDERLSPLYVSVHSTSSWLRSKMLRNDRGGFSLRWMRLMLEAGIDVRAQIVLCPGVNDGDELERTLADLLEQCPDISSIAVVPLGLSRFNPESSMRVHTATEASAALERITRWQERYSSVLGRQPIHAADELYLVAGSDVPPSGHYGDYPMLEDGVGLVRSFVDSFEGRTPGVSGRQDGFFSAVDRRPNDYVRAVNPSRETSLRPVPSRRVELSPRRIGIEDRQPVAVVTGAYGAVVLRETLTRNGFDHVPVIEVTNSHFGGNTAVAGLMTSVDIRSALTVAQPGFRFLLPDVCLNDGVFLDGGTLKQLQDEFDVEVIETNGESLRKRLDASPREMAHV
jgi:putative radical SAM enzyme (TIGR03279 family)